MKPIIIYDVMTNNNGLVEITKEQFEKYINESYNNGYAEGKKEGQIISIPQNPYIGTGTSPSIQPNEIGDYPPYTPKVWCGSTNNINMNS